MKMYINKLKWLFVRDIPLGRLPVQKTGWNRGGDPLLSKLPRFFFFFFPLLPAFSKIIDLMNNKGTRFMLYSIRETIRKRIRV